ncbi:hypothetical protein PPYR_00139 [Photinus pyralis]|uniref:Protein krueppel n=1 Tax=Photinus pyralis TaxID=7054 RepID=A0A5N4B0P0_PHOPY|nr:zinc finger protein 835-like [Photinus pyralis]XP_031359218.1 zinc finger protein 835-like [Photinus pyralis]KAB0803169.1 hypothetical protein PPYR_00139 [Photinus pyralis]
MQVTYLILPLNEANKTLLSQFNIIPGEAIEKNVNESCRICLRQEKNLICLYDNNEYFESMSISDAIDDCFGVKLSADVKLSSYICPECAIKTQDAHTFKRAILKRDIASSSNSQHIPSDKLVVKPFLPVLTEDLNTIPSETEVNGNEIKCKISPVAATTEITPPKKETTANFQKSPPLYPMVKDKTKPLLSILRELLNRTSKKSRCRKKKMNKENKSTSASTVLSSSQLKMNVKRTYTRKKKGKIVSSSPENKALMNEHNYTKSSIEVTTEKGTELESTNESIPADCSSKTGKKPPTESKTKKYSIRPLSDSMEKWWVRAGGPPYQCKLCDRNYGSRYSVFYTHVRTHFMKKHPCTICGKRFFSDKLVLHMRSHTNERPFLCEQCPARFIALANLKRHLVSHTGEKPYICEVCGKGFTQNSSRQTHMEGHNQTSTYVCEICGVTLNSSSYRNHKSKYHREATTPIESNEKFPCDQCNTVFSKSQSLTRHYKVHNSVTYKCKLCDATFEESYSYEVHAFIHEVQSYETDDTEEKPFHCKFCLDIFDTKNDLEQHLLIHINHPYKCKNCEKSFSTKLRLRAHMQKYCASKPFSCADCGKTFRTFGTLYQHKKTHSGIKKHICQVCYRAFLHPHQLMYHMLTHTGEKKYVCQYCGKAFALNGNLTVHVRRHTGETPYVCKVCHKGFYDSSSRTKHMRTRHRNELVADDASNNELNVVKDEYL